MTILIPLGTGSRWQNNELRFCLRSICQHLQGWSEIVIIGTAPDWLKPDDKLTVLPFADKPGSRNKENNIHRKIMHGIEYLGPYEEFLFMNDDHFILKDMFARYFPYHHKGTLAASRDSLSPANPYRRTLANTIEILNRKGITGALNYDTHCPIIYHGKTYMDLLAAIPFPGFGYGIKSLYCNLNKTTGFYYPDLKFGKIETVDQFYQSIVGRIYFSIGNQSIGPVLERELNHLYPDASRWE